MFKGSFIFSKDLPVHRHDVVPVARMAPLPPSTNLSQDSSDEGMESLITDLGCIGSPGKMLTKSGRPRDSNNATEPNRHALRPRGSRSLLFSSLLFGSWPKPSHRHECAEWPLAEKDSNTSSARKVASPKHLCADSTCDQRHGPLQKCTPAQSLPPPGVYDSDDEVELTMIKLRSITPPAREFHTSEPLNDLSSTFPSGSGCSSSFELSFSDPTADDDHARQVKQQRETLAIVNRLTEEAMDKRSSFGSIIGDDEDGMDDFIMPIWPAKNSISKSLRVKNSLSSGV